jgi:chemotaxis protein MotA
MDLATLIGLVGGVSVIVSAILLDSSFITFVNVPSFLIVFGGTFAVTLIKFPVKAFFNAFKVATKAFVIKVERPQEIIEQAIKLAAIVRREGLLALEHQQLKNSFFNKGLQLCVDGHDPEFIRKILETERERTISRHEIGQRIFRAIGDAAPAMGMMGTLVGLVQMLTLMQDPKAIGPAMAVALLTTLYGAIIANLVAIPIADKLELRTQEEATTKTLIIEGIDSILESRNPRVIQEHLKTYLPPKQQQELH